MAQTIGQVIREARIKKGLTQRQLAALVKKEDGAAITPQYLNDIEFDRRTPSEPITRGIAEALDLDQDYLVMLAGTVPKHILENGISEETAKEVVSLFRRRI